MVSRDNGPPSPAPRSAQWYEGYRAYPRRIQFVMSDDYLSGWFQAEMDMLMYGEVKREYLIPQRREDT